MGLAANRTCGGRCHSCLPTLSQSWDESWQTIRWPAPRMSSRSESTAAFSSDAVTASSFYDATYAVSSQIREPHAVRVRLALCTLRQAIPVHCTFQCHLLACLSTLNQQCRQPKQQIRKLAYRLYTLACWIASLISAKAGLFHGQTLPSSTTGTRR